MKLREFCALVRSPGMRYNIREHVEFWSKGIEYELR